MPTRLVREGIITSKRVNRLTIGGELFFRKLLNICDDYGRFEADPTVLRTRCYPLRIDQVSEAMIETWRKECWGQDLIRLYQFDGSIYLQVERFNQRRPRSKSRFPDPEKGEWLTDDINMSGLWKTFPAANDGQLLANDGQLLANDGQLLANPANSLKSKHIPVNVSHLSANDGHLSDTCQEYSYTNANAYTYANAKTNTEAKSYAEHYDDFAAIPGERERKERRISKSSSSAVTARGRLLTPSGAAPHQGGKLKKPASTGSKDASAAPPLAATSGGHSTAALDNIRQAIRKELGPKATKAEIERKFAEYTQPRRPR